MLLADNEHLTNTIWMLRRKVGEAVKSQSIYKEEDTVVPRAKLPQLLNTVKSLGREYGFRSVCYGHAGDGNLHINILRDNLDDDAWNVHLITAIETLFKEVVAMGGTISGEHGIGLVQRRYMPIAFSPVVLAIMKGIKHLLDPKGIMNPCKIF